MSNEEFRETILSKNYRVNIFGDVQCCLPINGRGKPTENWRPLRGYCGGVTLCLENGVKTRKMIDSLVFDCFGCQPLHRPEGYEPILQPQKSKGKYIRKTIEKIHDEDDPEEFRLTIESPHYRVSAAGRVQSQFYIGCYKGPGEIWREIKKTKNNYGYHVFSMRVGDRRIPKLLHVCVCELFNGPKPSPDLICLHKNDNRDENHADNLEWGTYKENTRQAIANGKMNQWGENNATAKLTEENVIEIVGLIRSGAKGNWIAKKFNVSNMVISRIKNGSLWSKTLEKIGYTPKN